MDHIFIVCLVNFKLREDEFPIIENYTYGWFKSIEEATSCALKNSIYENHYEYAVIEKSKPGWGVLTTEEMQWFAHDIESSMVMAVDKPEQIQNIVAFSF